MKFHACVTVSLKKGVLDPQGTAVERATKSHGYQQITNVRIGKSIELDIEAESLSQAQAQVKSLADQLLANPVMEVYAIHIEES